jgi:TrkA-C domain
VRVPQALVGEETLEQALRQLVLYGPDVLPVVSPDWRQVVGWITSHDVVDVLADRIAAYPGDAVQANMGPEWARDDPSGPPRSLPNPLPGLELIEIAVTESTPLCDRPAGQVEWPPGSMPVAITRRHRTRLHHDTPLRPGDHVIVLAAPQPPPQGGNHSPDPLSQMSHQPDSHRP